MVTEKYVGFHHFSDMIANQVSEVDMFCYDTAELMMSVQQMYLLDTEQNEASTPNKLGLASLINSQGIDFSWYVVPSGRTVR